MTSATPPPVVVFDVCDTLYDANTTLDFVNYYQRGHDKRRIGRTLSRWRSKSSPFFYLGAVAHRLFGWDIARQQIIASLEGEKRDALAAAVSEYVRDVLAARANHVLHERLESHRAAGDRIILLSSSLDLVIGEIATILDVEYRASELGFENGACTGRLLRDLTGNKAAALELLEPGAELWVYTDNRSDRYLLDIAARRIIVLPLGRGAERWGGSDCEYISL
jgi:HAD superfamily phosphoserine phosphatase-like hydrolase